MKFSTSSTYTIAGNNDPVTAYEENCIENDAFYRSLYDALGSDVDIKSQRQRWEVCARSGGAPAS